MKILSKVLATLCLISVLILSFVVPSFAATSGNGELNHSDKMCIDSVVFGLYGTDDILCVTGNDGYNPNYYTDWEDVSENAPRADYLLTLYGDKLKGSVLRTWYANYYASDQYAPHYDNQVMYYSFLRSTAVSNYKPVWDDITITTTDCWLNFDRNAVPYIATHALSTNVYVADCWYEFSVYEPVTYSDETVIYEYQTYRYNFEPFSQTFNLYDRITTRLAGESAMQQFIAELGYEPEYYNVKTSVSYRWTNIAFSNQWGQSCEVAVICPGYSLSESEVFDKPLNNYIQTIDVLSWIPTLIDNVLSVEIFQGLTIGNLLLMVIAIPALVAVLKLIGGVG